jgi:hypothetical protein
MTEDDIESLAYRIADFVDDLAFDADQDSLFGDDDSYDLLREMLHNNLIRFLTRENNYN